MSTVSGWIISDDLRFSTDLLACLDTDDDDLVVERVSWESWQQHLSRSGWPKFIAVDLREPSAWQAFEAIAAEIRKNSHGPLTIGILDRGYPVAWARLADETLHATTTATESAQAVAKAVSAGYPMSKGKPFPSDNHRALVGSASTVLTSTPSLYSLLENLEIVAKHDFSVLLMGETGTGKTTIARLIHELSPRKSGRFLTVPCGTLPKDLIDSDLFGHVKGAFTGADTDKTGKFEAANGGTILLDEIDVLGFEQQAKLLRILETGEFEPVGSNETRTVDARIIVASNVGLDSLCESGNFRSDLYYRLNQVGLEIPPLRDRPMDIVPLASHFIVEVCREMSVGARYIESDVFSMLRSHRWPGNIRELRNEVRRAVLFSRNGVISRDVFSPQLRSRLANQKGTGKVNGHSALGREVARTEQEAIEQMLRSQNFNRAATARALGVSRVTLYNKIRKYGIRLDSPHAARE